MEEKKIEKSLLETNFDLQRLCIKQIIKIANASTANFIAEIKKIVFAFEKYLKSVIYTENLLINLTSLQKKIDLYAYVYTITLEATQIERGNIVVI